MGAGGIWQVGWAGLVRCRNKRLRSQPLIQATTGNYCGLGRAGQGCVLGGLLQQWHWERLEPQ